MIPQNNSWLLAFLESFEDQAIGGLCLEATRAQVTLSSGCPLLMGLALVQLVTVTRTPTTGICALSQPISPWQLAAFERRGRDGCIPSLGRAVSMCHRPGAWQTRPRAPRWPGLFLAGCVSSSHFRAPKSSVSYDRWHFWEWALLFCILGDVLSTSLASSHVCIFKFKLQ